MKNNIILIGMPGSGKSTIGVIVAKMLGYNFIDADLIIQNEMGKRLYEIIEQEGNEAFLEIENQINSKIEAEKTVIATGGSAIYGKDAMRHFKSIGKVVYIKVPPKELQSRIKNFATRGIVMEKGQTIEELYCQRHPLYEAFADMTVECLSSEISENAEKIAESVKAV